MIDARGLTFQYGTATAPTLDALDLRVREGERVAVVGPNGAGKTTLLRLVAGLLHPTGGTLQVAGRRAEGKPTPGVAMLWQDPEDQLFMPTVADDVAFGPRNQGLRGDALRERVDAALAAVGMAEHRSARPHQLSFGQQKRIALAGLLAMRPRLSLLDEPTANLDPHLRSRLTRHVRDLPGTVLMATHDLEAAVQATERIMVLDRRIVFDGRPGAFLDAMPELAPHGLRAPGFLHLAHRFGARDGDDVVAALRAGP